MQLTLKCGSTRTSSSRKIPTRWKRARLFSTTSIPIRSRCCPSANWSPHWRRPKRAAASSSNVWVTSASILTLPPSAPCSTVSPSCGIPGRRSRAATRPAALRFPSLELTPYDGSRSREGRTTMLRKVAVLVCALLGLSLSAFAQDTVKKQITEDFKDIDRRILDMARDWPADKYNYKLKPEMRSFGAVLVHIVSGNVYAAKKGRGQNVKWDELDPAKYPDKASVLALLEKSITDSEAVLAGLPAESFTKTVQPWLDVLEHSGEHYGLLVAYYRANGVVPPESRPKPK